MPVRYVGRFLELPDAVKQFVPKALRSLALTIAVASSSGSPSARWYWVAVVAFGSAIGFTVIVNVPINIAHGVLEHR
ncbi:anthrone oxygenase family protein [Plantactinospora sp. CA-294935]|uniref:anthrone oxygenase family protein n=1 Tax=Plantactinospora sp. CA-294935 TaxID=3240012 RepID=UPI003D8E81BF